jgi:hypothetical protein
MELLACIPQIQSTPPGPLPKSTSKPPEKPQNNEHGIQDQWPTPPFWPPVPTSTPAPGPQYLPGPTNTSGPTITPTPQTLIKSQGPHLSIYIDWNQVDYIDLAIDGVGVVGGVISWGGTLTGQPEVILLAESVSGIFEFAGFVKSAYEVYTGDPSSMLLKTTTEQVQYIALASRFGRIVPWIGLIGNGISSYINLKPQISYK